MDRRLLVQVARFAAVIALLALWRPESVAAYGAAAVVLCLVLVPDAAPARREPAGRRTRESAERSDFSIGFALLREGRMEEAEQSLRRAIAADAEDADARFNLGIALAEMGRHEPATAELEEAARLRPRDAAVRYRLGISNAALGRHFAAIHALRESIRLDPRLAIAGRALERSLAAVGTAPARPVGEAARAAARTAAR
jgi:tetratricopeptide (TPR) repeat protein